MQAVCEGVARVGGLSICLLPDTDASQANPFVSVPLATGIGEARNALIARASFCLIAIGDSPVPENNRGESRGPLRFRSRVADAKSLSNRRTRLAPTG